MTDKKEITETRGKERLFRNLMQQTYVSNHNSSRKKGGGEWKKLVRLYLNLGNEDMIELMVN